MIYFLPSEGEAQTMSRAALPARAIGGQVGGIPNHDTAIALNLASVTPVLRWLGMGMRFYIDVDDNYADLLPPEMADTHRYVCKLAHGVICASEALRERYSEFNKNVIVIRSASACPPRTGPNWSDWRILGWAAGKTHVDDYDLIEPVLRRAWELGWEVDVMGDAPCPDFATHIPYGSLSEYYQRISYWDIGLAPLKPGPVNDYRSDLKWQDYSSAGVMTIASDQPAYRSITHGYDGFLAAGPQDFIDVIERCTQKPSVIDFNREHAIQFSNHRRTYLANAYKTLLT